MNLSGKARWGFLPIEWITLFLGLFLGTAWFIYIGTIDFLPYPDQADAVTYFQISERFTSFWSAFQYAGDRTFGFPFFLYAVKRLALFFVTLTPENLVPVQSAALLIFQFAVSIYFYRVFRVHPLLLLLLLIHPGLIGHTGVLLTDTFTTNLVMIAVSQIYAARSGSLRSVLIRGAVAGLAIGWAVGSRPSFFVTFLSFLFISAIVAGFSRQWERSARFFIPFIGVTVLILLPSVLNCKSNYGQICQQDPRFAKIAVTNSLTIGITSPRMYWSIRSQWDSKVVIPQDLDLVEKYSHVCNLNTATEPKAWLGCIFSRPFYIPVYAFKKIIAVFDNYLIHPYTVDVNPAWARRYNRAYGALAFSGFIIAVAMLIGLARKKMSWELLAFTIPVLAVIFQIPMHVEGRYSFPAVPISLFAFLWMFRVAKMRGRKAIMAFLLVTAVLSGTFIGQTHSWDLNDFVLQQIEGWN